MVWLENSDGDSVGEPGGVDKVEGSGAEEVEEAIHKDGQELQREGGDPKQKG